MTFLDLRVSDCCKPPRWVRGWLFHARDRRRAKPASTLPRPRRLSVLRDLSELVPILGLPLFDPRCRAQSCGLKRAAAQRCAQTARKRTLGKTVTPGRRRGPSEGLRAAAKQHCAMSARAHPRIEWRDGSVITMHRTCTGGGGAVALLARSCSRRCRSQPLRARQGRSQRQAHAILVQRPTAVQNGGVIVTIASSFYRVVRASTGVGVLIVPTTLHRSFRTLIHSSSGVDRTHSSDFPREKAGSEREVGTWRKVRRGGKEVGAKHTPSPWLSCRKAAHDAIAGTARGGARGGKYAASHARLSRSRDQVLRAMGGR